MAIGPAPNGSCCPAGITDLLGPKRSVLGGLFKSPNRLRWLAHTVTEQKPQGQSALFSIHNRLIRTRSFLPDS